MIVWHGDLDMYGIRPRTWAGLRHIFVAPFLHGGFGHLFANTVPFLILGLVCPDAAHMGFLLRLHHDGADQWLGRLALWAVPIQFILAPAVSSSGSWAICSLADILNAVAPRSRWLSSPRFSLAACCGA